LPWTEAAKEALDELVSAEPVLVRISAAKRLRDAAERAAQHAAVEQVGVEHLPEPA
jgi:chlorophyllide a reductase subunit Z